MSRQLTRDAVEYSDELIREKIASHRWYQPVSFGNGIQTYNWAGPHTASSFEFGVKKWDYIIKRNLPDLQGLRVLDVGCNCGLYCIEMARAGAREVVGIDSDATWPAWREQALLVKEALEWRCGARYNVQYIDAPMTTIPELDLGRFDVALFLCSIYYLSDHEIHLLLSHLFSSGCPYVVLQGNTNRRDQCTEVHRRALPAYLANALKNAGWGHVRVDAPLFYSRPIITGSRDPVPEPVQAKRDRLRSWLRSLI